MIFGKSGATSQAQHNEADWRLPYVEGPDTAGSLPLSQWHLPARLLGC